MYVCVFLYIYIDSNFSLTENRVSFSCHLKRGGLDFQKEDTFELVKFVGYFRKFGV
jgi:hypothetical protein